MLVRTRSALTGVTRSGRLVVVESVVVHCVREDTPPGELYECIRIAKDGSRLVAQKSTSPSAPSRLITYYYFPNPIQDNKIGVLCSPISDGLSILSVTSTVSYFIKSAQI